MSGTAPHDENNTVPHSPETSKRRALYDYSRTSNSGNGHWYSGSLGESNPLNHNSPPPVQAPTPNSYRPSQTRKRVERRRSGKTDSWAWVVIAGALLGMTLITTMLLVFVLRADKKDGVSVDSANLIEPTSIFGDDTASEMQGNSMLIQPWNGSQRFTVLLMGLDKRPDEPNSICRTDTMMVVSIDPVLKSIGILSIPRDTYVQIPGYGEPHRINEACVLGNLELPGKGPRLAMQTIQLNFGIPVNDYVMVNFSAFTQIIDRIGGVDIYVQQEINDPSYPDMYYGYDPFYIAAGWQHLDGVTALKYARSRHTSDDIDRGRRQQEIVFAVRDKVLSVGMVDDLLTQALPIWNDLNSGIETGLTLDQMIQLALYIKDIPDQNIKNGVLDWSYLVSWMTPRQEAVLIPDRNKLVPLMLEIFGEGYNQQ